MNEEEQNHPKLEQGLRGLAKDQVFVPPPRDEKIIREVQEHFAPQAKPAEPLFPRSRRSLKAARPPSGWQKWLPLAASITIAGLILFFSIPREGELADLNSDGVIDIIDALFLAEQLEGGGGKDVNRDGRIDERDVEEIAARAVQLERSGS